MRVALAWIACIIAVVLIFIVITFAVGGGQWLTAPFRGAVSEREQTQGSGTYRIAQYDKFFDQCNAIIAAQDNLELAKQLYREFALLNEVSES